jgi:hypothetical protein
MIISQKWEGYVIKINNNSFTARLTDLMSGSSGEKAEFPLEKVSKDDLKLVVPGAIFYWFIGHKENGIYTSILRFRRLPIYWSTRKRK